jgi:hypothetical protein
MLRTGRNVRVLTTLSVCLLFLAGQAAAALHAFEHDAGPLPGKGCSTCVTASQIGAASVDTPSAEVRHPFRASFDILTETGHASAGIRAPKNRGPPPGA